MPTDTKLQNLIINDLTEEQYNALTPNENELYLTPDTSGGSSIYKLTLSESQMTEFEQNQQFTLTDEQHTNLLNSELINFTIGIGQGNSYVMNFVGASFGTKKLGYFLVIDQESSLDMLFISSDSKIAKFSNKVLGLTSDYIQTIDNYDVQNGIRIITNSASSSDQIVSYFYFDTINNNPILHTKNTDVKNYDLGKTINLFGKHSILVPSTSTDTAINLYNHFIKITGTADSDKKIVIRFTIQSSKDTAINTIENLSTLLGNEFELGCSGIYSTYNITGLKKNADISLSIIYNNNGAESLLSSTGLTLTISDTVKTI